MLGKRGGHEQAKQEEALGQLATELRALRNRLEDPAPQSAAGNR